MARLNQITTAFGVNECAQLDDQLSQRSIALDPLGYFLIRVDVASAELVVEHYCNTIDEKGLARDPVSGAVIACRQSSSRTPSAVLRGRTAKEVGIALVEGDGIQLVSRLDHALYLGRELQKAEQCLRNGKQYQQD